MEAVTFTNKIQPHSLSFSNSRFGFIKFRKTHVGFEPKIQKTWTSLSLYGGGERERERLKKEEVFMVKKKQRGFSVKCSAEGIERGLMVGGRSEERRELLVVAERFKVVALMACVMCLCNADRVVMSVAIVPLAAKHGWSNAFLGIVQSSFLWGYIFSSVIGGALVDKYGGKKVIAWGAALWSLATLLTPWAANHSTISLLAIRAFFGLAEGVALPSMNTLLSRWFPCHERATAVGISMGGFHLGNVMGLVLTPLFMTSVGISGPFILFSSLGLLWLITWISRVTNDPKESNSITNAELRLIQAGKSDSPTLKKGELPPLRMLLSKMPTWAIIFANVTNNWGYFVLLSWMPVYFKTVFNVNLKQAAWFSAVPWGTMAISGYVAGAASDFLIKAGYSLTFVRKVMQYILSRAEGLSETASLPDIWVVAWTAYILPSQTSHHVRIYWSIGFIGPGLALLCLNYAKTPEVAAVMITIALSFSSFSQAGFLLNMQDIAPQYAGFLHGISNSAGTLAAIISTIGTGFFVQWLGSFQAFLTLTACLYFVTAIFWNIFATGERVF